jgi:hypothetical protein
MFSTSPGICTHFARRVRNVWRLPSAATISIYNMSWASLAVYVAV